MIHTFIQGSTLTKMFMGQAGLIYLNPEILLIALKIDDMKCV